MFKYSIKMLSVFLPDNTMITVLIYNWFSFQNFLNLYIEFRTLQGTSVGNTPKTLPSFKIKSILDR